MNHQTINEQEKFTISQKDFESDEIFRVFNVSHATRKSAQWIRFVIGGDLQTTQFCMDRGVTREIVNATNSRGFSALGKPH